MADVAARAGVSRALVSIVFRGRAGASQETRERVLRVADEIGYRPDSAARLLARGRSRTLGVMFTVHQAFHTDLIEGIYPEAERLGYDVLLSAAAQGRSEAKAVEALLSHRCEALILLGPDAEAAYLDELGQRAVTVSVGRREPRARVDFVHSAEAKGARQAMDHLVELGHRRIVHLDGGRGAGSAERRRAYRAAMRRHGLESEVRVIPGAHTEQSGIDIGLLLLAERDRGLPLPTAVLAGNDRSAMGLLMSLTRAGVDVPRDLSVVGYDDSHLSHLMPIGLTTVRQDALLMAEHAVRFAVERLENPELEPREAVLDPKLVVRGTSGPPPHIAATGGPSPEA
ncbi:DNA-binding LacI/PurR family transcriptional regulator [Streptomyces umbrinus]|uniref:LacI family DNA-binding transcriptional regulator n=1 Tax=Streptomyces umbrinus TaxID=67370 RepID=UPI00167F0815|nr:LacI family DNA-binding transcriptional regulator [Streptomyces umbrinus]MCR3723882.1 DNA-binding LacI/PurR family transcriptional regulator [Streptomyces umbrinus]GHH42220.1 LacI family transcriptional regulator [Streptomyces umbrinus]